MKLFYYIAVFVLFFTNLSVATQFEWEKYDVKLIVDARNAADELVDGKPHSIIGATNSLLFKSLMTEPHYTYVTARNIPRLMNSDESICVLNRVKNDARQSNYLFSLPVNFFTFYRLFKSTRQDEISSTLLTSEKKVKKISKVLENRPDTRILITEEQSYGEEIDAQIANIEDKQKIELDSRTPVRRSISLLLKNDADWLIVSPDMLFSHLGDKQPDELMGYPLAGLPDYITGHIMCNKTRDTMTFLAEVNDALLSLYTKDIFVKAHVKYAHPDSHEKVAKIITNYAETAKNTRFSSYKRSTKTEH